MAGRAEREAASARPLIAFFALAFAISWAWALPFALTGRVVERGDAWPTHYPALLGPAIAAFVVTAWESGTPGVRDLLARMARWRVGLRWWLAALSPAGFLAVTLAVMAAAGSDLPDPAGFGRFSGTPAIGVIGVFLLITCVGSLGEETGWRGYALPGLQTRFSPLAAALVLAPLWFLWHLPQFFLVATYRDFGPVDYTGMLLGLTAGSVVLTWLYNRSGGSVLLVVVWHGVYNLVGGTEAAVAGDGTIAAAVSTLIMVQGIALAAMELVARRHGRRSILGPRPAAARP
jgi:uncharacterized protein